MHNDLENTPVDIGKKIYRLYHNKIYITQYNSYNQHLGEQIGHYHWYAKDDHILLESRLWGLQQKRRIAYGQSTAIGVFLQQGQCTMKHKRRWHIPLWCAVPEVTTTLLIFALSYATWTHIQRRPIAIPEEASTAPSIMAKATPNWVLRQTPLKATPIKRSKPKPVAITHASFDEIMKRYLQGDLDYAKQLLLGMPHLQQQPKAKSLLAEIYYIYAMQAWQQQDLISSKRYTQNALQFWPQHQRAKKIQRRLVHAAQDIFMEAYIMENAQPRQARIKYEMVTNVLRGLAVDATANKYLERAVARLKIL